MLTRLYAVKDPSFYYKGDEINLPIYLQSFIGTSTTYTIPTGATFRAAIQGDDGVILIQAPDLTVTNAGLGLLQLKITSLNSAKIKVGYPTIMLLMTASDGAETTFEIKLPLQVKARPLSI